ncbi:hypothetical protein RhiirA5_397406 [Rhizophagus irregularis]|uniref:F-box domain-containing protein n=3 Tax=Rhizophagus irregularis TaxID=588596 RepID=A0A2I1ED48_9GLOM|nr:hypothetical protein RhiirA5_397406 [Rhizophagus irregularis]GBC48446.1 hypothetical protein GLOIN_2v1656725 [Rhizophagus irregularis DAOM 181602=DAOM 197198]PKC73223.1 hypothetical protein RhiirA1_530586 [Rhizophagus irregularis]PKY20063.1 hypothetical protein RhiirB3_469559 [Rhizophagus irregularis]UZO09663.1 hypothetical protein OCT59_029878 [Rhizophagus irregularis]
MASRLPNETLQHIFSYVEDIKSLYSIIQVNHAWSQNSIKFLYKKPFRNDIKLNNQIEIIFRFLPFIEKDKDLGKHLRKFLLDENDDDENLINDDSREKVVEDFALPKHAMFDYPSFVTHLDFQNLFSVVTEFFIIYKEVFDVWKIEKKRQAEQSESQESSPILEPSKLDKILSYILTILRIIATRRANIIWLKIDLRYKDVRRFLNTNNDDDNWGGDDSEENFDSDEEHVDILKVTRFYNTIFRIEDCLKYHLKMDVTKNCFTRLEYLNYGRIFSKLNVLRILSNTCKSLKTIQIEEHDLPNIQKPLTSLIKNQHQLEHIRIIGDDNSRDDYYDEGVFEIMSSLETVAGTLKKIEFLKICVRNEEAFKFLIRCENLESLYLEDSYITLKNIEWISSADLSKLGCLKLINNQSNEELSVMKINPFEKIFQNKKISSSLNEILLQNPFMNNFNLLRSVGENCRNLAFFSTYVITEQDIKNLFIILENCSKLELLNFCYISETYTIKDDFIINLAKKLPGRLLCLGLYGLIRYVSEFRYFLENCAVNLKLLVVRNSNGFDKFAEYEEFVRGWSEEKGITIKEFRNISDKDLFLIKWE